MNPDKQNSELEKYESFFREKHLWLSVQIKKLNLLFKQKKYFEIILKSTQLIDICCDFYNWSDPKDQFEIDEYDQSEIESHTGLSFKNWSNLKLQINKSLKSESPSWKTKILKLFDETLEISGILAGFQIENKFITQVNNLNKVRNNLSHSFYKKETPKVHLKKTATEAIHLCSIFMKIFKPYSSKKWKS
jgi:hypothetical protein